jgi:hypothetical protein
MDIAHFQNRISRRGGGGGYGLLQHGNGTENFLCSGVKIMIRVICVKYSDRLGFVEFFKHKSSYKLHNVV